MMFGLNTISNLKKNGLLGINSRNCDYVYPLNERRLLPLVDCKITTKVVAGKANIPTPEQYGVIDSFSFKKKLEKILDKRDDFVIKPARGAQGDGILVVDGRTPAGWRKAGGKPISRNDIDYHLRNIVSGMYSRNAIGDRALIEQRVVFAPIFEKLVTSGVPDIRVIVFKGRPILAMVRLPTAESDGKANLHKGGIGVGIDMDTGMTTNGVHKHRYITRHPDSFADLAGIEIPDWKDILDMASRSYEAIDLGYLGVDIVIDERRGPLLLELNARPGLGVQMANQIGLCEAIEQTGL